MSNENNNEALPIAEQLEKANKELEELKATLVKANKTITNLFQKEPLRYPQIAKTAIVRTLTLEKINAEIERDAVKEAGGELWEMATAFKRLLMMIHQEIVDVEKVDPNNELAKKVRHILGNPDDFEEEEKI